MSEVSVTVGGRVYRVACARGEEDRVRNLATLVNAKLETMGRLAPQDAQNLLFASLMLADETHEAKENASKAIAAKDEAEHNAQSAEVEQAALRSTIADLESEIVRLKNSAPQPAGEMEGARNQIEALTQQIAEHETQRAALSAQIATLIEEKRAHTSTTTSGKSSLPDADDPNLTLALERFAEQLEFYADRLESKPTAS
ncbi:cell division protein ZapA [Tsuneonella flava]|uniref:Cell division protein ZapA n=1 Tax=Tsuneonella flava TaxID=2055955 RepID=A0ABX7K9N2_9SPHN|nr:cell division protein ZapA [Tsuneonella flava]QSB43786.1 cell division protein ZapA [Tsuneonella flava]